MASGIVTAVIVIVFVYLLKQFLTGRKHKLPPGPIGLPIIGHFHLLGTSTKLHKDLWCLAQKHGPLMHLRLGAVPTLVVSSPAGAELILKTHDSNFATRAPSGSTKYLAMSQKGVTFGRYGHNWRMLRKLVTLELLSQRKVNQFQGLRQVEMDLMLDSIKQHAMRRETVDISARLYEMYSDVICQMIIGKKSSSMDDETSGQFYSLFVELAALDGSFNIANYFPYLRDFDLQGHNKKYKNLSKRFDVFFDKIIDDHQTEASANKTREAKDFVDMMFEIMEAGDAGFEFDRSNIKAVLLELLGSSDTAAITLEWTMSELLKNPKILKKLQKELEAVVGLDRMVEESDLLDGHVPYLDCVIKESLRLHPLAPLLLPHEAIEDIVVPHPDDPRTQFHIAKATKTIVNIWGIARDPAIWPNPEAFSPERFMDSDINVHAHQYKFLPFGAGRRGCPGLLLGMVMVRLAVAQLVHCFDWELPNGISPDDLDMTELFGFVSSRANHLIAIPTYRLNK